MTICSANSCFLSCWHDFTKVDMELQGLFGKLKISSHWFPRDLSLPIASTYPFSFITFNISFSSFESFVPPFKPLPPASSVHPAGPSSFSLQPLRHLNLMLPAPTQALKGLGDAQKQSHEVEKKNEEGQLETDWLFYPLRLWRHLDSCFMSSQPLT